MTTGVKEFFIVNLRRVDDENGSRVRGVSLIGEDSGRSERPGYGRKPKQKFLYLVIASYEVFSEVSIPVVGDPVTCFLYLSVKWSDFPLLVFVLLPVS